MTKEQRQSIQDKLHELFPLFSTTPAKPLIIGAGKLMSDALVPYFDLGEIEAFTKYYFSRRDYRVALLNTVGEDARRYDLLGAPSDVMVTKDEQKGLARCAMFKNQRGLTKKARAFVMTQRQHVTQRNLQLKKQVVALQSMGFSREYIVLRMGKRAEKYLNKQVQPQPYDAATKKEVELMRARVSSLSLKEIKAFQRNLFEHGQYSIGMILDASGGYEPLLYELVKEKMESSCAA